MIKNLYYLTSTVLLMLVLSASSFAQRLKFHRISAEIEPLKLESLFNDGFEVDHFSYEQKKYFAAEVSDEDIAIFKKHNVKFKYEIEDLEKNLAKYNQEIDKKALKNAKTAVTTPANFSLGSYAGFYTFAELQTILDQMRTLYPNLISAKSSIGTSIEGRPILMVKISDNPDVDEAEPEMFFNAVHHAREPMSMSQLIFFMWHILENYNTDKDIKTLVNSTELFIVPCVNPDGYVYNQTTNPGGGGMWRKNRRNNGNGTYGVDINRNYGFMWGFNNTGSSPTTSSDTYRGTAAFSEPETQVIRDFCNSHNFTLSMDFHSYGNYCIYPFGYTTTNPNPELALFQQMGTFLVAENGFVAGNATQTVAYTANGAGDDWKYGEQTTKNKIYSFTPEVGASTDGFWPASSRIIPLCNATIEMNKKAFRMSTYFGKATPTNNNSTVATTSGTVNYTFQNFSVKPTSYTVSVSPVSSFITSVGSPKTYTNYTLLQNQADNFAYTIDPLTPLGTQLKFALTVNNGLWAQSDTITITYDCLGPNSLATSGVGVSGATLSWGAVAGASNYYVSFKENSSSTWGADILVTGATTYALTGLNPATTYNWRVRTENCTNWSSTLNFQTQPLCGNPTSLSTSSLTSTSVTLNWGAVSGVSNYTVEYKAASSSTWIVAASAITSTSQNLTGLVATTLYDWRVRANCPAGNSAYISAQFTTPSAVTYCASKGNSTSFMWIDYVNMGTINRTSGSDAGYFNGTSISTNAVRGTSRTIVLSCGFSGTVYRMYWRVFIDYNRNGVFTDAGEQVTSFNVTTSGNTSRTFTIPSTAALGTTRMRVVAKYSAYATSCETFTYGEVEDYTINITASTANARTISAAEPTFEPTATDVFDTKEQESQMVVAPSEADIQVFPNPVTDRVTVRLSDTDFSIKKIKLFNSRGKEIFIREISSQKGEISFDMLNQLPGAYYLYVSDGIKPKTIKIIKD